MGWKAGMRVGITPLEKLKPPPKKAGRGTKKVRA
jgi:hypothetical protein